jgi:anti-sigma factor RsiW
MNADCFDIGTIQAFLDGELDKSRFALVSEHIGACEHCAIILADAEEETSFVFSTLEREMNGLVPTQRLWSRINDSIAEEKQAAPFWQKAWAYVSIAFASPSITAAAGLLIVFGVAAIFWMGRSAPTAQPEIASAPVVKAPTTTVITPTTGDSATTTVQTGDTNFETFRSGPRIERAAYAPEQRRVQSSPAVVRTGVTADPNDGMPGEESYIRTIASLSKTVEVQKDAAMRPSERIAYERDMAVVNDTIARMRQEVKKNPKNSSAKQILYSSYQNKIDLLNSVSQKEELMASLER